MPELKAIDADGHLIELGADLAQYGWTGESTGHTLFDDVMKRDAAHRETCAGAQPFDGESRLADLDAERIAVSVNYPSAMSLINQVPAIDVANRLAQAYNSWAYDTYTSRSGGRVLAMALVNLSDPAAAVAEARRAMVELGAAGIMVPPFTAHVTLDDPALDPLWALAEELDVAIGVHGGRNMTEPHLRAASFNDPRRFYAMAHPFSQMFAMGDLVLGAVLHRFQRLRVAFLESGIGWVRWYADRLDEAAESVRDPITTPYPELDREPSEYILGGRCFFSCEPDEPGLQDLVRSVGEDLVVFASDYPHFDCKFPQVTATLEEALTDTDVLRKVTFDNPLRLYGAAVATATVAS